MTLLEYLTIGSYVYTTGVFVFLHRLVTNHHSTRLKKLEHEIALLKKLSP